MRKCESPGAGAPIKDDWARMQEGTMVTSDISSGLGFPSWKVRETQRLKRRKESSCPSNHFGPQS